MVPRLHNARQTTSTAGEGLLRNERRQHSWRGHTTPVCESSERGGTASCRRPFDGRFIHFHLDKRLNDGLFHWFVSKHVTNVARTAIESAFSAPQLGIRDRYRVVPQPRSPSANTAGEPQRAHTFQARLRTVPWGRRAVATKAAVPPRPPLPVPQRALVAPMTCILSVGQGRVLGHGAPSL